MPNQKVMFRKRTFIGSIKKEVKQKAIQGFFSLEKRVNTVEQM